MRDLNMAEETESKEPKTKETDYEETQAEETESEKAEEETHAHRYRLAQKIMGKETFIEPLNADQVTRAYSVYGSNQQKIVGVVIEKFRLYCRKCIREAALLDVKNELSQATINEAGALKNKVIDEMYEIIKKDQILEQLIVMLVFKNRFWDWIRYGLKEILNEQRSQPGHEINNFLNTRFHTLKKEKNIKVVGDLVVMDVTDIVNNFKKEIMKKSVKIF